MARRPRCTALGGLRKSGGTGANSSLAGRRRTEEEATELLWALDSTEIADVTFERVDAVCGTLEKSGGLDAALRLRREASAALARTRREGDTQRLAAESKLGALLRRAGNFDEAREVARRHLGDVAALFGADAALTRAAREALWLLCLVSDDAGEERALRAQVLRSDWTENVPPLAAITEQVTLAELFELRGDGGAAYRVWASAIEILGGVVGKDDASHLALEDAQSLRALALGKFEEARSQQQGCWLIRGRRWASIINRQSLR